MDENLVGYLLRSLDADTQRQVEAHLRTHPEARRRLETLRRFLEPLEADRDGDEPPAGLALRTLACIAHDRCRQPPRAGARGESSGTEGRKAGAGRPSLPPAPTVRGEYNTPASAWSWHRRADVLVAAGIVVAFVGLVLSGLGRAWSSYQLYACQDNLRKFHVALTGYSDTHHGDFPQVQPAPPHNLAGVFVPVLSDSGLLGATMNVDCPAVGQQRPPIRDVSELQAGCYAYSLGYSEDGQGAAAHRGLSRADGDLLPILSDRPLFLGGDRVAAGNSPNHGGRGQNVLHIGGHVDFCTQRTVGVDRDDIFVNREGRAAAGTHRQDTVLGAWRATPYPGSGE
jgi:hypothetical protein